MPSNPNVLVVQIANSFANRTWESAYHLPSVDTTQILRPKKCEERSSPMDIHVEPNLRRGRSIQLDCSTWQDNRELTRTLRPQTSSPFPASFAGFPYREMQDL